MDIDKEESATIIYSNKEAPVTRMNRDKVDISKHVVVLEQHSPFP